MIILGVGVFGMHLDHEGGAFMNGVSVLIKEIPQNPSALHHVRAQ